MTENYMDIKRNYVFCCVGKDQNFDGLLLLIDGKNKEYQLVQLSEKLILFCCIDKDPQAVELKDTDGQTVSFEYIYYRTGIQTFMLSQSHFPEAAIQSIRLLMISDKKEFNLSLKKGSNLIPFDLRLINSVKLEDSNICIYDVEFDYNSNRNSPSSINETVNNKEKRLCTFDSKTNKTDYSRLIKELSMASLRKAIRFIRRSGWRNLFYKLREHSNDSAFIYNSRFLEERVSEEELAFQRTIRFHYSPLISVITPTFNTPKDALIQMIESVLGQSYENWELCVADGSSINSECRRILKQYSDMDSRIKVRYLNENYGISGNTNKALELAQGDYITLLDHDDFLELDCFFSIVKMLQDEEYDIIYTDEDKYDEKQQKFVDPHFKPDFNYDLLLTNNYITHLFVVKKDICSEVEGFKSDYDGSQDYDYILRCIEKSDKIGHLSKIVYHWRIIDGSTAGDPENKMYCYDAGRRAIQNHLYRRSIIAQTQMQENSFGYYRSQYSMQESVSFLVIINAIKGNEGVFDLLYKLLESKQNIEKVLLLVSHEKELNLAKLSVPVVMIPDDYQRSIRQQLSESSSDSVLIVNGNCYPYNENSISELINLVSREDVGIVTPKVTYKNRIDSAGKYIDNELVVRNPYLGSDKDWEGYMRHLSVNRECMIPNSECIITRKNLLVQYLEEINFSSNTYRYVNYSFILKQSYHVVFCPFSVWENREPANLLLNVSFEDALSEYQYKEKVNNVIALVEKSYLSNRFNGI